MSVKVIAGEVFGVKGPITARTPAYFIDFNIKDGVTYKHKIPAGWNSMIICHQGQVTVQERQKIGAGSAAVFKQANQEE